jgi:hypothetical protein
MVREGAGVDVPDAVGRPADDAADDLAVPNPPAGPARTAGVDAILEQIRRAPSILDVFSLADELAARAARAAGPDGEHEEGRAPGREPALRSADLGRGQWSVTCWAAG